MTQIIRDFDPARVKVNTRTFRLKSMNLNSVGMLDGEMNPSLLTQRWVSGLTFVPQEESDWRRWDADIASLGGISGLLRIADPVRRLPYYNIAAAPTGETWDDGTTFDDGTKWASGLLPPTCTIDSLTHRGAKYAVFAGLPVSITAALRYGDVFEIRPNGVAAAHSHFYLVNGQSNTNSAGKAGVQFVPGLRQSVRAGDQVVLIDAKALMRLGSDDEGEINVDAAYHGRFGLSLVEVLPRLT